MAIEILRPNTYEDLYAPNGVVSNPTYAYDGNLGTAAVAFVWSGSPYTIATTFSGMGAPTKTWISSGLARTYTDGSYASPNDMSFRYIDNQSNQTTFRSNSTWSGQYDSVSVASNRVNGSYFVVNVNWGGSNSSYIFFWDVWVEGHYLLDVAPSSPSCTAGLRKNTLTWGAVSGATSYNGYWTNDGSTPTTSSNALTGITSGYEHTSLTAGTNYHYKIAGVDSDGVGAISSMVEGTPYGGPRSICSAIIG